MTEVERLLRETLKKCDEVGFKQIWDLANHSLKDQSDTTIGFMTIKSLCSGFKQTIDEALSAEPQVCRYVNASVHEAYNECDADLPTLLCADLAQDVRIGKTRYCPGCGDKIEVVG